MKKMKKITFVIALTCSVLVVCTPQAEAAPPLISAHRGGWVGGYPDNSARAFAVTHQYAKVLETDVRETSDHEPIFTHDPPGSKTYAQMRVGGSAGTGDLAKFMQRSSSHYALVEVKQSSYSSLFWTNFNVALGKYASRIIFYSLSSNNQVRDIRIKYGYKAMYHPRSGVPTPTRSQILYVGNYVWRSPCSYSSTARVGIRFLTGLRETRSEFAAARKCAPWSIITDYARTAVIQGW